MLFDDFLINWKLIYCCTDWFDFLCLFSKWLLIKKEKCLIIKKLAPYRSISWFMYSCYTQEYTDNLTHLRLGQNRQRFANGIFKCILLKEKNVFRFKFHLCLFLRVKLTICQDWIMVWWWNIISRYSSTGWINFTIHYQLDIHPGPMHLNWGVPKNILMA